MKDYDADVFDRLSEFNVAREALEQHKQSIILFGDVICNHGLEKDVGISFLHKHFDISQDEILIRQFVGNTAYMRPLKAKDHKGAVPYLWKFDRSTSGEGFYPLEFVEYEPRDQQDARVQVEMIAQSHGFLSDMADKLIELGLTDVFGIVSLYSRKPFSLKDGETLLELTDKPRRTLTLEPALQSKVRTMDTTQTLWIFTPPVKVAAQEWSGTECNNHCISHCQRHCNGHKPSSRVSDDMAVGLDHN